MTIRRRRQNFHKSNSGVVFKQVLDYGCGTTYLCISTAVKQDGDKLTSIDICPFVHINYAHPKQWEFSANQTRLTLTCSFLEGLIFSLKTNCQSEIHSV